MSGDRVERVGASARPSIGNAQPRIRSGQPPASPIPLKNPPRGGSGVTPPTQRRS
jgi:hypothetical protein